MNTVRIFTKPEAYITAVTQPIEKNIHAYLDKYGYPIKEYKSPNDLIELAGRHCYMSFSNQENNPLKTEDFVKNRFKQKHFGLAEHVSFSIILRGVSRGFTHEMVRHRLFSFSQASTRYCKPNVFGIVRPKLFDDLPIEYQNRFIDMAQQQYALYDEAMQMFENLPYQTTIKTRRGQARSFLTNMIEAPIYISGNLRTWHEMKVKRMIPEAELEFQAVVTLIDSTIKEICNVLD